MEPLFGIGGAVARKHMPEEPLGAFHKRFNYLEMLRLRIVNRHNFIGELENRSARIRKQQRRMCGNDELSVPVVLAFSQELQEGQLTVWRESRFRFVEQVNPWLPE